MIAATALAFGVAWWLGLYLIARDPRKPILRRAGLGLLAYAGALALGRFPELEAFYVALGHLPALAWTGVILRLLPFERLDLIWRRGLVPVTLIAVLAVAFFGLPLPVTVLLVIPLVAACGLLAWRWRDVRPRPAGWLAVAATLLFALGVLLPFAGSEPLYVAGAGLDLVLLGVAVSLTDAFDEGENLRHDMLRSLLGATVVAGLFGGQAGLAMLGGVTVPLTALLFGTMAAAIAVQVLANPLHGLLDRVVLPGLRRPRAELREAAEALPRRAPLDDADLVRLTRRALSNYGDLGRLVASPLTELDVISARLAAKGAVDSPLERANELKALLLEGIQRLKPQNDGEFGTSDEWRYYNALYFPYVEGIRPYRQRATRDGLSPATRRAFDWFAAQVPERTLHNWQNAAARLVAEHLRTLERDPT